jgi:hypothetical protein
VTRCFSVGRSVLDFYAIVTSVRLSGLVRNYTHLVCLVVKIPYYPLYLIFIIALLGVNIITPSRLLWLYRQMAESLTEA